MKCASAQLLAERYSDHTKAHGNHRCLVSRGKRIGFAWPGEASGEGAWLLAKWFGGDTIRVLCPVVASAVGLVKREKETGLPLFGRGLTVVSDYCEKHTALTRLFCLWALEIAQLPCELNQFSDVTEGEPYRKWTTYAISSTSCVAAGAESGWSWKCLGGQVLSCCCCLKWIGAFNWPKWHHLPAPSCLQTVSMLIKSLTLTSRNLLSRRGRCCFFLSESCCLFHGRILTSEWLFNWGLWFQSLGLLHLLHLLLWHLSKPKQKRCIIYLYKAALLCSVSVSNTCLSFNWCWYPATWLQ